MALSLLLLAPPLAFIAYSPAAHLLPLAIRRGPGDRRAVALTFDDGPDPVWTPRALEVLDQHGAQATFFLVGERARAHPEVVRAIVKADHEIGAHGLCHRNLWWCSKGEFRVDPADLARPVTGRLEVNPGSLDTGIAGRDQDLREHLEVKRFPAIVFVPKEVRAGQASLPDRGEIPVTISGLMTIHGVERPVEFSGKARLQEGGLRVEGVTALKMSDYGITRPTKLFFRVGDEVKVRFRVEAANPIPGPLP